MKALVAILGPTAIGKSTLSMALASAFNGEIINADSRQVYKSLDIGTSKPSIVDRSRIAHHLFDIVQPDQDFSLFQFLEQATHAIQNVHDNGKLPILVGGTGQYIWALLEGWQAPPVPPDYSFRQQLEEQARTKGTDYLHDKLARVDPNAAATIHPHNVRRISRALEVHRQTGIPFSQQWRKLSPDYKTLNIGLALPRKDLYKRIDDRIDAMFEQGWLEEVTALVRAYPRDLPAFSSLGYRELMDYLEGKVGFDKAVQLIKNSTHRFARHQQAWFRQGDPRIQWIQAEDEAYKESHEMVTTFLSEAFSTCAKIEKTLDNYSPKNNSGTLG
jgi:tRNA dimethylallyltransferase